MAMTHPLESTSILLRSKPGAADALAGFLAGGAAAVHETEPLTLQWIAQREGDDTFRIVDFFASDDGRQAHFAGQVAAALQGQAPDLVAGGWDGGVVPNITNAQVLSSHVRDAGASPEPTLACHIQITAQPGQEDALAAFLTAGAEIVRDTEPGTLLWYAIRLDTSNFAIYDVFVDEAARDAHFAGTVAAALQESASTLVEGGWEDGVVNNVVHANILSLTY